MKLVISCLLVCFARIFFSILCSTLLAFVCVDLESNLALVVFIGKGAYIAIVELDLLRGPSLGTVGGVETAEEQKKRFEVECEFVQALANPHYLNFLAQRGYFRETYFINYLKYLLYWKRPEYARALKYPQCLHFLEAVQSAEFREAIACTANAKFIEEQQILQWQYYTRKRQRLHSVNPPTRCEACVLFAREFEQQLASKSPTQRSRSERELWLLEAMEGQCKRMLDYKLHKEKDGLARFSKQESSTMKTLNKLRQRGVKVELGMPYEMWDKPSVEIASLKQQCELILERYEEDIEQWFFSTNRLPLEKYLCEERVLKGGDLSCIHSKHAEF